MKDLNSMLGFIDIYVDLLNKGQRAWTQELQEEIVEALKNCNRDERLQILIQLTENVKYTQALGFLKNFKHWGPYYILNNYQSWQSDVEEKLSEIFESAWDEVEAGYRDAYEYTMEELDEEDRYNCDDELYSFEEWMSDDYWDERAQVCKDEWNNFVGDNNGLKEYFYQTIELLEDLGEDGLDFLFDEILFCR